MSLKIPSSIIEIAKSGCTIPPHVFIEVVQASLPALWTVCNDLVRYRKEAGPASTITVDLCDLPDEQYGEVLRGMASTAIHRELNRHFDLRFEMMEERRLSAFPADKEFTASVPYERVLRNLQERRPNGFKILENLGVSVLKEQKDFTLFDPRTMRETDRIELLHLHAIYPDRAALEAAYGVEFAFKNCCASAGKGKGKISSQFEAFCSIEAQILHQTPEMTDC